MTEELRTFLSNIGMQHHTQSLIRYNVTTYDELGNVFRTVDWAELRNMTGISIEDLIQIRRRYGVREEWAQLSDLEEENIKSKYTAHAV